MNKFKLKVAQIDKLLFDDNVVSLNCPGVEGEMTVLAHHIPLITLLKEGVLKIKIDEDTQKEIPIKGGILEVGKEETIVLLS